MLMSPPLRSYLSANIVTHDKPKFTVLSPMLFRDRFPLVIMSMVLDALGMKKQGAVVIADFQVLPGILFEGHGSQV